jgi:hypothetical protein
MGFAVSFSVGRVVAVPCVPQVGPRSAALSSGAVRLPPRVPGVGRGEVRDEARGESGPEPPAKQPKVERSERAVAGRGLGGGTSPEA